MKRILSICFCLALLISTTACNFSDTQNSSGNTSSVKEIVSSKVESADPFDGLKQYKSDSGLSIYMAKGFKEDKIDGAFCYFESDDAALTCTVETFELLESAEIDTAMSEKEYAELIKDINKVDSDVKTDKYSNVYFTYEKKLEGNDFTYFAYIVKTDDAFYTCNFICQSSQVSSFEDDFALWASSIEIK